MSRRVLQGLAEIAEYLGVRGEAANIRRLVLSWIAREGLPARRLSGRWYADVEELEAWWSSRPGRDDEKEGGRSGTRPRRD
jgi:hypothetical protein